MEHRKILLSVILAGLVAEVSPSEEDVRQNGLCPWSSTPSDCDPTEFRCKNSICINRTLYCNGFDDCGDNSDEVLCQFVHLHGLCPWSSTPSDCDPTDFRCKNSICIHRTLYCNGFDDCGDNSDEAYCIYDDSDYSRDIYYINWYSCPFPSRCELKTWFCDGTEDCPIGTDKNYCGETNTSSPITRAINWLYRQKNSHYPTGMWGSFVDKTAVALYLASNIERDMWKMTRRELAYEASIELLSKLSWKKLQDIPSTELASFVNAFLVTCLDPRNFHGLDIVRELRSRTVLTNHSDPYVLLSLCNAGETMTELDKTRLVETFRNKKRTFWTDTQAVVVMALACASKQPLNGVDWKQTLRELTIELKQRQYRNGTVENFHTTALVMQALLSSEPDADPDNFDERKAIQQILAAQEKDGSFGGIMNTYYVLPLLNCKSLVDVSSEYCGRSSRSEASSIPEMANRSGPKIHVHYSVWIGNGKDLERMLTLEVPQNISLYGVIEMAAEADSRFRCEYTVKEQKPYVNAVYGLQNDPEGGKFWFLYTVQDGNPIFSQDSPADIIPKANEHIVMWYRSGPWLN